ncbi:hypothetical protein HAX54_035519 [Datura stramonium]|uniref:Uncharacterized protein n=1 Tax=Datura stramonium TaxID=4076 RepID=A0ABS8SFF1_DATST|nr:hypothetical protein [Datura stramonium]
MEAEAKKNPKTTREKAKNEQKNITILEEKKEDNIQQIKERVVGYKRDEKQPNYNNNEGTDDQWKTQKRKNFRVAGGMEGMEEKTTNFQDGVSKGGDLSHVLNENQLIDPKIDSRAPATSI